MRYKDQIDIVISAEDLAQINAALDLLENKLGFLRALDTVSVKRMAHFGIKNETFALGAFNAAGQNTNLIPPGMDLLSMERDMLAREQLAPITQRVQRLYEKLTHTRMLLGADIYGAARAIYKSLKEFGRDAGLIGLIEELGRRFKGQGPRRKKVSSAAGDASGS